MNQYFNITSFFFFFLIYAGDANSFFTNNLTYLANTALTWRNRQIRNKLTKLEAKPDWYFPVKIATTVAKGTVETTSNTNHDLKYLQMPMKSSKQSRKKETKKKRKKSHFLGN